MMDRKTNLNSNNSSSPTYLDIQAEVGITKHYGGYTASEKLYQLCHLDAANEVLEVGCGIGIGPVHIAKLYNCHVMAIDISEKMLEWAKKRASRDRGSHLITFRQADILNLPFEDERFDGVIVESLLAFVKDKEKALRELIRVTKPGKYIGVNESFWRDKVPSNVSDKSIYNDISIAMESELQQLWEQAPLNDKTMLTYSLDAQQELKDRLNWIGWRGLLAAWARAIKLILTRKDARNAIRQQMDVPDDVAENYGYGLYVGRRI
jgi:ubiquinone/menaquinone biosynthesis C-methylase UbiE